MSTSAPLRTVARHAMGSQPHLVVDISGHGFGHAGQLAPVLGALHEAVPGLRLTIRSTLPDEILCTLLPFEFAGAPAVPDVGMVMCGPVDVDPDASYAAYAALHAQWPDVVASEAARLAALEPTLLLADIPHVSLAAASAAGIRAVALCSLNWADIFQAYCGNRPGGEEIHRQILDAYGSAEVFLQPEPSMPMPELPNRRAIGPIARRGRDRRTELRAALGAAAHDRLVLLSFGGIGGPALARHVPQVPDIRWIATGVPAARLAHVVPAAAAGLPFIDLLASCDAVVTKPGYGLFVESVCNGTRILSIPRPDWPEAPGLETWARRHGVIAVIPRERLEHGAFLPDLEELLAREVPPPPVPSGVAAALGEIRARLGEGPTAVAAADVH